MGKNKLESKISFTPGQREIARELAKLVLKRKDLPQSFYAKAKKLLDLK